MIHRLLGRPHPVQGDTQVECQVATNGLYCGDATGYEDPRAESLRDEAAEWRLLLQVVSPPSTRSGVIRFILRTLSALKHEIRSGERPENAPGRGLSSLRFVQGAGVTGGGGRGSGRATL